MSSSSSPFSSSPSSSSLFSDMIQSENVASLAANLSAQIDELQKNLEEFKTSSNENNDAFFLCSMALIIFLMQCGFAFLEAGAVRSKNCTNILIKNVLDSLLGILGYWAVGWALAYGPNQHPTLDRFFGLSQFFASGLNNYAKFFFQFVFAATAATIISGAVAERAEFACFLTYSLLITSFCYPILTHWGWTENGWMAYGFAPGLELLRAGNESSGFGNDTLLSANATAINKNTLTTIGNTTTPTTTTNPVEFKTTYVDFAGSGMVHLCGGTISLIAAALIGPRIGRFPEREAREMRKKLKGKVQPGTNLNTMPPATTSTTTTTTTTTNRVPRTAEIKGHSVPFASLGGFILMFGFLAFNGGSTGEISKSGVGQTVAKAMVNTILCGAFAALSYLFVHFFRKGKWTILLTINACLTGMVSACAGCNIMPVWTSTITGSVAGMAYLAFAELCLALGVDDPLDAFAVHFGGGLWGLISACLVTERGLLFSLLEPSRVKFDEALWQLCWQMFCATAIIVWSALVMTPAFLFLKAIGKMRVPREVEIRGLDIYKHGEAAYPLTAYGHGWDEPETSVSLAARQALRNVGGNVDVAIEELAQTIEGFDGRGATGSLRRNPQKYEHPEHWEQAKEPNILHRHPKAV